MRAIRNLSSAMIAFWAIAACRQEPQNRHSFYHKSYTEKVGENPSEDVSCRLDDGTYTANVICISKTKQKYTDSPEIEVADCRVVRIYYPNNHRRDETNMLPALIGSDSNALARDTSGNEYQVHIKYGSSTLVKHQNRIMKEGHTCGYTTKKGTPCQRRVKSGHRCFQHGG